MLRVTCAFAVAVVSVCGVVRGQAQYTVTDLGPGVYPNGINSAGHVAAMRSTGNQDEAVVWDGTLRTLGISGFSRAWDINDAGRVAIQLGSPGVPAAHDGTLRQLGTLGGTYGASMGVNNAGDVVGLAATPNDAASHAFLYRNGQMTDLGTLAAGQNSLANDINDAGVVVGRSAINPPGPEIHHAFLWDGTMHDLGALATHPWAEARAVNDRNHVVGYAEGPGFPIDWRAWLHDGQSMRDLGTLGGAYSSAYDINDSDQVVGFSEVAGGDVHAFLYDGTLRDLNGLISPGSGWVLWQAFAVNDAGQIAGVGQFNGAQHGFLLTPVPEPWSAALAAAPVAGLLARRHRSSSLRRPGNML